MVRLGIGSLIAGFFIGVFSGVSGFMEKKTFWVDLTINKIIGDDWSDKIIGAINIDAVQDSLDYLIYEIPFFCDLLGLGVILLVISLFFKNH